MGKTENGAIWLNENLFSAYDYWQFWRNTDDRDVKKFLNYFTEIEPSEIDEICNKENNINNLKIILANEATKILHGVAASKKAEITAKSTFGNKSSVEHLPEIKLKLKEIRHGISLVDFLSRNKIISSKSEARRVISNRGVKLNNLPVEDVHKVLEFKDFNNKKLKLSFGKKKHYLIKII